MQSAKNSPVAATSKSIVPDAAAADTQAMEGPAGPEGESVLDTMGKKIGIIPWWAVSGAFHLIVLTLFMLMMMDVPRDTTVVTIIGSEPVEQIQSKEEPPKPKPALTDRPITFNPDEAEVPDAVVPMTPVDVIDHTETEDDMNSESARGKETNIGNLELGGYGAVGVMGVGGGGGGGAYGRPTGGGRLAGALRGGGTKASETALDRALEWLAKHQEPDGHWDTVKNGAQESGRCDTAATGLALLAFLGAGESEKRGKYKDNVKRAIDWVVQQQGPDGLIKPGANGPESGHGVGYHHAICGLALAEAYGMAHTATTKGPAQAAVNYSTNKHQDGTGSDLLGWRYAPKSAGDISVTGWFIMQLKSARLADLAVPEASFHGALEFLDSVEVKGDPNDPYANHRYKYQPNKTDSSPMQTMIGCTARMFLGWPKEELAPAVAWAAERKGFPNWGVNGESIDWYFMYYGTMATYQMGGPTWDTWNKSMLSTLVDHQRQDGDDRGSWDPTGHYAHLGRVFSTANGALCLEVYYRYGSLYGTRATKH